MGVIKDYSREFVELDGLLEASNRLIMPLLIHQQLSVVVEDFSTRGEIFAESLELMQSFLDGSILVKGYGHLNMSEDEDWVDF